MLNAHNNLHDALYRQGDVLIKRVGGLPHGAQKRVGATLAYGEVTGHSHRFRTADTVQLWVHGSKMFLEVKAAICASPYGEASPTQQRFAIASLIHEEHRTIELPQGFYRVWKQREYRPDAFVEVED